MYTLLHADAENREEKYYFNLSLTYDTLNKNSSKDTQ